MNTPDDDRFPFAGNHGHLLDKPEVERVAGEGASFRLRFSFYGRRGIRTPHRNENPG